MPADYCWGCGDPLPEAYDMGDVYCDLCIALIMFNFEALQAGLEVPRGGEDRDAARPWPH
jgi:hypothetical protein